MHSWAYSLSNSTPVHNVTCGQELNQQPLTTSPTPTTFTCIHIIRVICIYAFNPMDLAEICILISLVVSENINRCHQPNIRINNDQSSSYMTQDHCCICYFILCSQCNINTYMVILSINYQKYYAYIPCKQW